MTCLVLCHRHTDAHRGWKGAPQQCGASLGLAASGVCRAWAWALCWPGRAGGGPIRAPSQNLPLSLVTAASLLCLAQAQPPHTSPLRAVALPSRFSRLGALVGRGLSKPQFPHLKTGRTGLFVPSDPAPPGSWAHHPWGACWGCAVSSIPSHAGCRVPRPKVTGAVHPR